MAICLKLRKRISGFRECALRLFIHYGLYSLLDGRVVLNKEKIDVGEYMRLSINSPRKIRRRPYLLDGEGRRMRYICLTTMHHEGLCFMTAAFRISHN
jgi:hypothetical protein